MYTSKRLTSKHIAPYNNSFMTANAMMAGGSLKIEICHDANFVHPWALIQYKDVILPVKEIPLWR